MAAGVIKLSPHVYGAVALVCFQATEKEARTAFLLD